MCHIENHSDLFHLLEQLDAGFGEWTVETCTDCIVTAPIMNRSNGAQPLLPPMRNLIRIKNWIRAFHADNQPESCRVRRLDPLFPMRFQIPGSQKNPHVPQ